MPIWIDKYAVLFHESLPTLKMLQEQAKQLKDWEAKKGIESTSITLSRSSLPNGVFDCLVEGIETPFQVVADDVNEDPDTIRFIQKLTELCQQQPDSEGKEIVLEHLAETRYVIQVICAEEDEIDWEINFLLPFAEGIGFLADSPNRTLAFFEFSHDDFMEFQSAEFFESLPST